MLTFAAAVILMITAATPRGRGVLFVISIADVTRLALRIAFSRSDCTDAWSGRRPAK